MNRLYAVAGWGLLIATCFNEFFLFSASAAEKVAFGNKLSAVERQCLTELIHASDWWRYMPPFTDQMMRIAKVARANLNGNHHPAYFYLIEDGGWCGTAGCTMLIGEGQSDGRCRWLYDGKGVAKIIVLRARDQGYRRLYLPCEVRFDGRRYEQLREECPNANVAH